MPLLPEQRPQHRTWPTLALDPDHTLAHGEVKRPEFLDQMSRLYEIGGAQGPCVVAGTDKGRIGFSLFGDSCVTPAWKHKMPKDLGRDVSKVVVVDDTPSTYKFNQENTVSVTPFFCGAEDTCWD